MTSFAVTPPTLIPVSDSPHLTSHVFYNYLIPLLHTTFTKDHKAKIHLDLRGIDTISPQALVGLLIVGEILRKHYEEPVDLILEWKAELLGYLNEMGFFRINKQLDLFNYDRRLQGGFEPIDPTDFHFLERFQIPDKSVPDSEVFVYDPVETLTQNVTHLLSSAKNKESFKKFFKSESLYNQFKDIIMELVENAAKHGDSPCYVVAYGNRKKGLICAASDIGIGFFRSLTSPDNLGKLKLFSQRELFLKDGRHNLRAILEAVYRRVGTQTFGIASFTDNATSKGGVVRIHSENTQIVFTQRTYREFIGSTKSDRKFIHDLMNYFEIRKSWAPSIRESPLRVWDAKLSGVHVEIEIPPLFISDRRDAI